MLYAKFDVVKVLAGDSIIIPGIAGKLISVNAMVLVAVTATSVLFKFGTVEATGAMPFDTNGSMVLAPHGNPWMDPATGPAGSDLILHVGAAGHVSGWILYTSIDP